MHARRSIPAVALIATASLSLAACSGGGSTATTSPTTSPSSATASPAAAPGDTTVRLLAHDSFVVSDQLVKDFEAATGYHLEVVTGGDAGQMVAGAVLSAGAPSADVLFGVDNTLVSRAVNAGIFAPYSAPDAAALRPELQSDTAGGVVTPVDFGDVCVNVDDAYFAQAAMPAPSTLDDLIKPQYKDLLVVEDPAASSPGLAFLLATIARYGDGWQQYWQALRDNGVTVAGSWTDAYEGQFTGGGKGSHPLVVSYATSPPAEIVYAQDPKPTEPSTSVMTDGCYRQVEYAGVLAGTANEAGAHAVIDWLLSEPVQADVPLSMFVFPARDKVALPDVFTKFAARVDAPLQLDPQQVADGLAGWLEQWGTVMGR